MEPRIIYDKKLGSFFIQVPRVENQFQVNPELEVFDLYPCNEDLRVFWSVNLLRFLLENFPKKAQSLWEENFQYCPACGALPNLIIATSDSDSVVDPIKQLPWTTFQCACGLLGKRFNLIKKGERDVDSIQD